MNPKRKHSTRNIQLLSFIKKLKLFESIVNWTQSLYQLEVQVEACHQKLLIGTSWHPKTFVDLYLISEKSIYYIQLLRQKTTQLS